MSTNQLLSSSEIIALAFSEFIKSCAGTSAKKLTGDALAKATDLGRFIFTWFQHKNDTITTDAISKLKIKFSQDLMDTITRKLDNAMKIDPIFAQDLQESAQEIIILQYQKSSDRRYEHHGSRDMINIENIYGNPKIGGT